MECVGTTYRWLIQPASTGKHDEGMCQTYLGKCVCVYVDNGKSVKRIAMVRVKAKVARRETFPRRQVVECVPNDMTVRGSGGV